MSSGAKSASHGVSNTMWREHLLHPDARGPLAELLTFIARHAGDALALEPNEYQMNVRRHRMDRQKAPARAVQTLQYVERLLGLGSLDLYSPYAVEAGMALQKGLSVAVVDSGLVIKPCFTAPLSVKAGGRFWRPKDWDVLQASVAAAAASLRPELVLGRTLSRSRLEIVLEAALHIFHAGGAATSDARTLKRVQRQLEKAIPETQMGAFGAKVKAYLETGKKDAAGRRADLERYVQATELSVLRAAMLVSGRPAVMKQFLTEQHAEFPHTPDAEMQRELIAFALSEDLQKLRAATGLKLEIAGGTWQMGGATGGDVG
jgi:hypothetical protein